MLIPHLKLPLSGSVSSIRTRNSAVIASSFPTKAILSSLPTVKETFEKRLIKEIPYLVFIIRVLTGNDGVMSDDVKQLLAERIKADWESERKLLSQRKVKILGFYDEYVKEYLK